MVRAFTRPRMRWEMNLTLHIENVFNPWALFIVKHESSIIMDIKDLVRFL
jgi:hypothetical protein